VTRSPSVHWVVPNSLALPQIAALTTVLDDAERSRAAAFVFPEDRNAFVLAHAMLRLALSSGTGVAPHAWEFAASSLGKPEISGDMRDCGIAFSLSHTRSMVACAITSGGAVGIDVERIMDDIPDKALIESCCASSEQRYLECLSHETRSAAFTHIWTLKEAVVKARGAGTRSSLKHIECALNPPRLVRVDDLPVDGWHVTSMTAIAGHVMTVAFHEAGLKHREFTLHQLTGEYVDDMLRS
jgi:4'-phosphopantetheinyl transferase